MSAAIRCSGWPIPFPRSRVPGTDDDMNESIAAGDILVQDGTYLPGSLRLPAQPGSNGWIAVANNRVAFEKAVGVEGLTFFFMAGEIKATVFGFDTEKALGNAFRHLIKDVKAQHCNSIEITRVVNKSFLKVPYVSVFAHARHLQPGLTFSGCSSEIQPAPASKTQHKRRVTTL
jgi:hypothetical protein